MPDPQNERPKSPPEGDERTPDKTQGQIKYAPGQTKKSEGGAGEPKVSDLGAPQRGRDRWPMTKTPKVNATKNPGLQDDHDPSDIGQRTANKLRQGIVRDHSVVRNSLRIRKRAQQTVPTEEQSQKEGPAAYAPHDEDEKNGTKPRS